MGAGDQPSELRVVVIDDDANLRQLLRLQFQRSGIARVVGEADGSLDAVQAACRAEPDVVLLDQNLGHVRGTELIGDVIQSCPRAMVAIYSGIDADTGEASALASGAFAYYEKASVSTKLPQVLAEDHGLFQRALAGEDVCAPSAAQRRRLRAS